MDFIQFHSILYKQKLEILDAGRSLTLVRPAAPLAACVLRHRCTSYRTLTPSTECHRKSVLWIKPTKNGCHGSVPWWIEMLILDWSVIIYNHSSLPILQIWRRPVKQNLILVWKKSLKINKFAGPEAMQQPNGRYYKVRQLNDTVLSRWLR